MNSKLVFRKITKLPGDIDDLVHESEREEFAFVNRLKSEWEDATNRFDAIGEFLLSVSEADRTIGICGVNNDPYVAEHGISRLRHLYVLPDCRNQSVGSDLVNACLDGLSDSIRKVRLRVPEAGTGLFYEKLGFKPVCDSTASHIFNVSE